MTFDIFFQLINLYIFQNKTEPLLTVKQEPKDEEGSQAKSQESKDSTNEGGVNEGVVKDESEDIWEEATGIKTEPQDEEVVVLSDDESGKENELVSLHWTKQEKSTWVKLFEFRIRIF